jgi:ATP-dependent Clp protease ATP-binding subunit ClpA
VRQKVEETVGRGQGSPSAHIPFTPRTKKVLELSLREAHMLGHDYIGTEHILLGLIREGDGVAAKTLVSLGADLNRVRQKVLELLPILANPATGPSPELSRVTRRVSGRLAEDALARVESLSTRLTAIERWVGMRADVDDLDQEIAKVRLDKEAAVDRQDFEAAAALRDNEKNLLTARAAREREWTEAAAGRQSLASELSRVKSELDRLRAIVREHGREPGDGTA